MFNPPGLVDILTVNNNAGGKSIKGIGSAITGTAGTTLIISTANSTGSAAGTDIQMNAGNASTSGAGGNLFLMGGQSAGGGANATGTVQIKDASSGSAVGQFFSSGVGKFSIGPVGGVTAVEFGIVGATTALSFNISMTSSSVNYFQATGATANNVPIFTATGSDTNVSAQFATKGTGDFWFNSTSQITANAKLQVLSGDPAVAATVSYGAAFKVARTAADVTGDVANVILDAGTIGTANASVVTNYNGLIFNNATYGSGLTVTRAAAMRFTAAVGTHKFLPTAVDSSTGGTNAIITINKLTANATIRTVQVLAYIGVDINGTMGYVPVWDTFP